MNIFTILGKLGPARQVDLLSWLDAKLTRDSERLGRPLDHDEMQRSYSRAVRKYRRRPTFPGQASRRPLRLVK